MSYITRHVVDGSQLVDLVIERSDTLGPGGAPHYYSISGFNSANNPSASDLSKGTFTCVVNIPVIFQHGVVGENGLNGITIESLLAIAEDRLSAFQNGEFACNENEIALNHINKALDALHSRTKSRMVRQVEGKMEK